MTPEKIVKDNIKKFLHEIGAYCYMPVSFGYSSTSIDFFACWRGGFYGIEAKRPAGGVLTARQKECLARIERAGGKCCVENDPKLSNVKALFGFTS